MIISIFESALNVRIKGKTNQDSFKKGHIFPNPLFIQVQSNKYP